MLDMFFPLRLCQEEAQAPSPELHLYLGASICQPLPILMTLTQQQGRQDQNQRLQRKNPIHRLVFFLYLSIINTVIVAAYFKDRLCRGYSISKKSCPLVY